jgi:hypothetical protein
MFKKEDDTWELKQYMFSTVPGLEFTITDSWLSDKNFTNQNPWIGSSGKKISMKEYVKTAGQINGDPVLKNGLPILVPSQYIDVYYVSDYKGALAMKTVKGAKQLIWRDIDSDNFDTFNPSNLTAPEEITPNDFIDNGIKIHLGYPGGQKVGNWSEGSQVFSNAENLNEFFGYCDKHKKLYDNKFTYTLATKNDWDEATKNVSADKPANVLATQSATQSATIASTQSGTQSGTQSAVEATIEQNKSGDIDVVGDGSLIVECIIQDVILTGSITTDDISRLNSEAIKFSIKSQSVPGEWSMTSASLSYSNSNDVEHGMSVPISSNVFILDIKKSIEEQPNKDKVIGDYKLKIDLTFVKKSNNSEKIINKAIQFKITKGSSSTSETKTETKPSNEYIIAILNPTTPNSKNVTGKITISKKGPQYTATGVISGFPDGGSIGPISGQPLSSGDESVNPLVNEMMRILENEMISKYKVEVKLVVTDKK